MTTRLFQAIKAVWRDSILGLKRRNWKRDIIAMALFMAVTAGWQIQTGAYKSEFGGHPDEAAHYVTGLMIRDYMVDGIPQHPMRFAENYYDHYPKVALGNWPPFFYVAQSAWTIPFGVSRSSLMIFMALLTAGTAFLLFNEIRKRTDLVTAHLAGIIYCSLPVVQKYASHVMTEALLALLATLSICLYSRYATSGQVRYSIAFGLVASCAILTKGSGMFLAFVPIAVVLGCRRFELLKRPGFWAAAVIVVLLCAPWTLATLKLAKAGWEQQSPSLAFTLQAIPYYWKKLFLTTGIALLTIIPLVRYGLLKGISGTATPLAATSTAFFMATLVLQPVIPCGLEPRHLVIAIPSLILFLPDLLQFFIKKGLPPVATGVAASILIIAQPLERKPKTVSGFRNAAIECVKTEDSSKLLVSSDASGEGMFISEVAMNEQRPGHIANRSSKLFANVNWSGSNYEAGAESIDEVLEILREKNIAFICVDNSMEEGKNKPHHKLIERTITSNPLIFKQIMKEDAYRKNIAFPEAVRLYRITFTD